MVNATINMLFSHDVLFILHSVLGVPSELTFHTDPDQVFVLERFDKEIMNKQQEILAKKAMAARQVKTEHKVQLGIIAAQPISPSI